MKSQPFHNGFGLQTIHGVAKPAWRAFQLLKAAGRWRASVTGASPDTLNTSLSVLATLDAAENARELQLFVADWSPADTTRYSCGASGICVEDDMGAYTDEALCNAQCSSKRSLGDGSNTVSITIKHSSTGLLGGGDVTVSLSRIDNEHANAKVAWEAMGRPGYLNKSQISELTAASQLTEEALELQRVDAETSRVAIALAPWSAMRILLRATDAVVSYSV